MDFNTDETKVVLDNRIRVRFRDEEREFIEDVAQDRARSYNAAHADCNARNHSPEEAHRLGFAGEYAVGKAYWLDLDTETYQHGDPGYDLKGDIDGDGQQETIDVKARTRMDARLIVTEDALDRGRADAYVLVYVTDSHAQLIGWCSRDELRSGKLVRKNSRKYRALSYKELRRLPGL